MATVEIHEPSGKPVFEFTGDWGPPEQLDQKQFPVRRCLTGPASLRVTQAPGRGSLRLRLYSLSPSPTRIEGNCSPNAPDLTTAPGPNWLTVPVQEASCILLFTPPPTASPPCLEALTWQHEPPGSDPPGNS